MLGENIMTWREYIIFNNYLKIKLYLDNYRNVRINKRTTKRSGQYYY